LCGTCHLSVLQSYTRPEAYMGFFSKQIWKKRDHLSRQSCYFLQNNSPKRKRHVPQIQSHLVFGNIFPQCIFGRMQSEICY
jgi:hypothetical protein